MSANSQPGGSPAQIDAVAFLAGGTGAGRWVVDPEGSRAEFAVKHFWGLITVRGSLGQVTGEGEVGADGTVTGRLIIDAASLNTNNKKRDQHLRSADFFDVENHPQVTMTVTSARAIGAATLACEGNLEAAGQVQPVKFTTQVVNASDQAVTLLAKLAVDRTGFSMTWSPMGMAHKLADATVTVRLVRA